MGSPDLVFLLLCFTCIESNISIITFHMLWEYTGLQIDSIGVPVRNAPIAFCMLCENARLQSDSVGVPTLNVSINIVFDTLWDDARRLE